MGTFTKHNTHNTHNTLYMNARLFSISFLLILAFVFSSCEEANEIIDAINDVSFSAKIDGEDFSVSGLLATAELSENQGVTTIAIAAAALPIGGVTKGFALAIVSTDSTGIKTGDTFTAASLSKIGAGEYIEEDGNTLDIKALSSNTGVATITVTAIDFDTKLISGTFSFDGSDDDDPNKIYEIREGKFTDVSFE